MIPETGAVAPGTRTTPPVSMPSCAIAAIELAADRVARIAEWSAVARASAQPGDSDRGIDRAAAGDGDEIVGHALAARLRERVDPENDVLHRDAGAEHSWR